MSQIALKELTEEWVAFTDITTPENNKNYYIQNRGPQNVLALESDSIPETLDGVLITPYEQYTYQKGSQTLYFRAYSNNATVNITKEE